MATDNSVPTSIHSHGRVHDVFMSHLITIHCVEVLTSTLCVSERIGEDLGSESCLVHCTVKIRAAVGGDGITNIFVHLLLL